MVGSHQAPRRANPGANAMTTIEVHAIDRRKPESIYLEKYARNRTSEYGEDGIVEKVFEIIKPDNRFCVEIGAGDGKNASNTWRLINDENWRAALIEADTRRYASLEKTYRDVDRVQTVHCAVDCQDQSLDNILRATQAPTNLDFLSLDIDGQDWHVWSSLRAYRPRLLLVEFNHTVPNDVVFIQENSFKKNQGASLLAFMKLAQQKGYELIATTITNAFFVVQDEFARFGIKDNSIDAMYYNEKYQTRIFQTYDGRLHLAGCKQLIWKKMLDISDDDIQPLPRSMQTY